MDMIHEGETKNMQIVSWRDEKKEISWDVDEDGEAIVPDNPKEVTTVEELRKNGYFFPDHLLSP